MIGAQIAVMTDESFEAIVARNAPFDLDFDSLFIEHGLSIAPGQLLTTDERGEVRVTEPGSWVVRAATADGVAVRRCEAGVGPRVLELTPACRIDVQVLDVDGRASRQRSPPPGPARGRARSSWCCPRPRR